MARHRLRILIAISSIQNLCSIFRNAFALFTGTRIVTPSPEKKIAYKTSLALNVRLSFTVVFFLFCFFFFLFCFAFALCFVWPISYC